MYIKMNKVTDQDIYELSFSTDGLMFSTVLLSVSEMEQIGQILSDPGAFGAEGWYTISTLEA